MATARSVVTVFQADAPAEKAGTAPLPSVFTAPLRPDLVRYVHTNIAKNKRQAYANKSESGYGYAAESWGTGRAVSRIPRVSASGTNAGSAGAFGNMCRGGGMFAPTKTWRRWHRKVNVTQKRHATATALAASALPALVMARGHKIDEVAELPLVVSEGAQGIEKTKKAIALLEKLGCKDDLQKVLDSKKIRAGQGKMRNRRYTMKRGPLVVYAENNGIARAFRAIPGVDLCHVDRLNLLQLAPGGTFGRLIVWTEPAFKKLQALYGSYRSAATLKKGYHLPRAAMTNADLARIINSDNVQSVLNPAKEGASKTTLKRNPLKNMAALGKLNPGEPRRKRTRALEHKDGTNQQKAVAAKRQKVGAAHKKHNAGARKFYNDMMESYVPKASEAENEADDE